MTREYILNTLKEHKKLLQERYSVEKIGLFGSYATNTATQDSDIDIYVKLKENKFDNIAGLWNFLEEFYKTKIDLFRENKRSKGAIYEEIKKETLFI